MADSVARRSVDDWEAIIERFLASGLSQAVFCRQEQLSRFSFSHRYQRSPQFKGKRRGPRVRRADTTERLSSGAFAPVRARRSSAISEPPASAVITMHIGGAVRIECPAEFALAAISLLAREAAR